jgi:hypothetical protein
MILQKQRKDTTKTQKNKTNGSIRKNSEKPCTLIIFNFPTGSAFVFVLQVLYLRSAELPKLPRGFSKFSKFSKFQSS